MLPSALPREKKKILKKDVVAKIDCRELFPAGRLELELGEPPEVLGKSFCGESQVVWPS